MRERSSAYRIGRSIQRSVGVLTFAIACTGDPYARYAGIIARDLDGTTAALTTMTARVQRTVVQNDVPFDSLKVWWEAAAAAAETARNRSIDFGKVTPPADLKGMHSQIGGTLSSIASTLQAETDLFAACAKGIGGGDSIEATCRARVGENYPGLSTTLATAEEDLRLARSRVQHLLSVHDVLLPESVPDSTP